MSARQRRTKTEKKPELAKVPRAKPARPTGKTPEAMVTSRHGTGVVTRLGKGFSMGELAGAGLANHQASDWGLRLDFRRRSVIDSNVASLKNWGAVPGAPARIESRVKEAEEEIEKVGREVKEEAVKVEKEAKKVERKVKEEAVRAEKAVRRKAKPKKKTKS